MKKIYLSIIAILFIILTITSVSYAWFTYVETKSLATFEAGKLSIEMKANDHQFDYDLHLDEIAYLDYQNDVILNKYNVFNEMATVLKIDILLDENAPHARHHVVIENQDDLDGLIYMIIYEGVNVSDNTLTTDYYSYLTNIIENISNKEDQLEAIKIHNQDMLDLIYAQTLNPSDKVTFQMILFGNYDDLDQETYYLDKTFHLNLKVESVNDKGAN